MSLGANPPPFRERRQLSTKRNTQRYPWAQWERCKLSETCVSLHTLYSSSSRLEEVLLLVLCGQTGKQ